MSLLSNMLSFFTPYMTKKDRILQALQRNGTVSLDEMARICKSHTTRIFELRKEGYNIQCHKIEIQKGNIKYTVNSFYELKK